ncbi:MAG: LptF/LptG family permease [Planctomycetota bacterium]
MFRIVDRYVLRQFVQFYVICYLSLTGLYIVIDAFGKLEHFVDQTSSTGELLASLGKYYGYQSLAFFNRTSGILSLIAAMFTVTWSQRYNEVTALLAAGVPRLRVLRPVILAAVTVSLGAAATRELVVPRIRHELARDTKNLSGGGAQSLQSRWDNQTDVLLAGDSVVIASRKILRPAFKLPRRLAVHGKQLAAAEADYFPPAGDRPGGYWLREVATPEAVLRSPSLRDAEGQIIVASPADTPWLGEGEVFVVSGVPFELLASGSNWRDYASTPELVRELASPSVELGADVNVAVHRRLLAPLTDLTLLMLGLPLVVSRGARNPFLAIGLALVVVTGFFLVALGGQSLGSSGWLRPALAAWAPLLVFVPVAVGLSDPLRH